MDQAARAFAYTTWVLMASLGVIVFSNPILTHLLPVGWATFVILLLLGIVYGLLSRTVAKRFIRKCVPGTRDPWWLAILLWLPPVGWILLTVSAGTILLLIALVTGGAVLAGFRSGLQSGREQRDEWLEQARARTSSGT